MEGHSERTQYRELKESWDAKFLKSLCAFANQDNGGVMIVGIADKGEVIGVNDPQHLLKKIPDDIRNQLKINATVKTIVKEGKTCIEITVKKADRYVDLRGVFYKRVGNTTENGSRSRDRNDCCLKAHSIGTQLALDYFQTVRMWHDSNFYPSFSAQVE